MHDRHPDTPLWAVELFALYRRLTDDTARIEHKVDRMSATSDASAAAITALQASVATAVSEIGALPGTTPQDVLDDAAALPAAVAAMQDAASKLDAAKSGSSTPVAPIVPVPTSVTTPRPGFS